MAVSGCAVRRRSASASAVAPKADDSLVKFCFETMDRIGGMMKNPFLKSLREQVDRGRSLSPKQFSILARSVGENVGGLPDVEEIRAFPAALRRRRPIRPSPVFWRS